MIDKSFVTQEQHQCVVCGEVFDTGTILMDKKMRPNFGPRTVTGMSLCPTHKKMANEGYVALIEADDSRNRLGRLAHIRQEAWAGIFNIPIPDRLVAFIDSDTMDLLEKQTPYEQLPAEPNA